MSARPAPDLLAIGDRLKAERERIGLTPAAMGKLTRMKRWPRQAQAALESGRADLAAPTLAAFAAAGADAQFIITGVRSPCAPVKQEASAIIAARQTLARLDPRDRRRLLLDLLAGELIE